MVKLYAASLGAIFFGAIAGALFAWGGGVAEWEYAILIIIPIVFGIFYGPLVAWDSDTRTSGLSFFAFVVAWLWFWIYPLYIVEGGILELPALATAVMYSLLIGIIGAGIFNYYDDVFG